MATKDNQLKVLLPDDVLDHLRTMATRHGRPMAAIIRESVEFRYKMECEAIPTCANGRGCYVAHLHLVQQPHATPITVVTEQDKARLVGPAPVVAF